MRINEPLKAEKTHTLRVLQIHKFCYEKLFSIKIQQKFNWSTVKKSLKDNHFVSPTAVLCSLLHNPDDIRKDILLKEIK